jgi:hypothetical protein
MEFSINEFLKEDTKTIKENKTVGRPREEVKNDVRIVTYLTQDEHQKFTQLAKDKRTTKSQLLRRVILDFIKE